MRSRLACALLAASALAACGGDDAGPSGAADPLAFLPAGAGMVAVVDVDLNGEPARELEQAVRPRLLDGKALKETLADAVGAPNWDAIEVLVGDELAVATPGLEPNDRAFVGAIGLDDEPSMRGALSRAGYEKSGEEGGADVFEGGALPVAIHGATLVFGSSRAVLGDALRAHEEGRGGFRRAELDRATTTLPRDALVRVYVNLARATAHPALRGMRRTRWVDALRTGGLALSATDGALVIDAAANTDAAELRAADLPLPPGAPATEAPNRPDAINFGSANGSGPATFLLDLLRAWRPAGRFAISEEVLRQFDGPGSSTLSADGTFAARSTVRDPKRMERTLRTVAPDVPRLAGAGGIERIDGERALYRIVGRGRDPIVFGLVGDAFVVATDDARARAAATEAIAPVPGARGAGVVRSRAGGGLRALVQRVIGVDPGASAEMTGSVQARRDRLRASARLRMP